MKANRPPRSPEEVILYIVKEYGTQESTAREMVQARMDLYHQGVNSGSFIYYIGDQIVAESGGLA